MGEELVAEACGDGNLVTALGPAAVENSCASLGGHAYEEAVNLATAAAVGLKGALGHRVRPVSNLEVVCWPQMPGTVWRWIPARTHGRGHKGLLDSMIQVYPT